MLQVELKIRVSTSYWLHITKLKVNMGDAAWNLIVYVADNSDETSNAIRVWFELQCSL
jgi:hypothetical protein